MHRHTRRHHAVLLALAAILALGLAACGDDDDESASTDDESGQEEKAADTIQIKYVDYAYDVSGPLNAGGTIEFENAGKELHMMYVGKLKAGKTLDDVKEILAEESGPEGGGEAEGDGEDSPVVEDTTTTAAGGEESGGEDENPLLAAVDEIGIPWNILTPGVKAAVTVPDLVPAKYAILCFIGKEGTGEPHFSLGMVNQFEVVQGDKIDEPTADTTYKIAVGKAPEGPATLSAGKHTIKFEKVGDADELEPNLGKLDPGKTFADANALFDEYYGSEKPPPAGAGQKLPADVFIGGDFLQTPYYYLTMDVTPGNWVVVAEDSEDADDPATPKELLEVKVT